MIRGTFSGGFVFEAADGEPYGCLEGTREKDLCGQVLVALTTMGFSRREAEQRVRKVLGRVRSPRAAVHEGRAQQLPASRNAPRTTKSPATRSTSALRDPFEPLQADFIGCFEDHVGVEHQTSAIESPCIRAEATPVAEGWAIVAGRLGAGTGDQDLEVFVNSRTASGSATVNITGTSGAGLLTIGAEHASGGEYFDGALSRLVIFQRPLSDDELGSLGCYLEQEYGIATTY